MNGTIVEPVACGRRAGGAVGPGCWENELSLALGGGLPEHVASQLWRLVI